MGPYIIDAGEIPTLLRAIERINRKAGARQMPPITLSVLRRFEVTERARSEKLRFDVVRTFQRAEIEVEGLNPIIHGYRFAGRIQHGDAGNVIDSHPANPPGLSLEPFRHAPARCSHCGKVRRRLDTYVLEEMKTGKLLQVGSTCIADFLGTEDAVEALDIFGLLTTIEKLVAEIESAKDLGDDPEGGAYGGGPLSVRLRVFLATSVALIRVLGFVSRKMLEEKRIDGDTTGELAMKLIIANHRRGVGNIIGAELRDGPPGLRVTEDDAKDADAIIAWAKTLQPTSEFLGNVRVLLAQDHVSPRNVGYVAAAAFMFLKERVASRRQQANAWVGEIGKKVSFRGMVVDVRTTQNRFGGSTLVTWRDPEGRTLKWFATGDEPVGEIGSVYQVVGTVKAHDTYQGEHQTVLTRCKVGDTFALDVELGLGRNAWQASDGRRVVADPRAERIFLAPGHNKLRGVNGSERVIVFEVLLR